MNISDLPDKYKDQLPPKENWWKDTENIENAFSWAETPQGHMFWKCCNLATNRESLPPLPSEYKDYDDGMVSVVKHKEGGTDRTVTYIGYYLYRGKLGYINVTSQMMSNCGMRLLQNFKKVPKDFMADHKEDVLEFYKKAAHGYPTALATHNHNHEYMFHGWELIDQFVNPNSTRTIHVWKLKT